MFLFAIIALTSSAFLRITMGPCPDWLPPQRVLFLAIGFFSLTFFNLRYGKYTAITAHTLLGIQSAIPVVLCLILQKETPCLILLGVGIQAIMILPMRQAMFWLALQILLLSLSGIQVYGFVQGITTGFVYQSAILFLGLSAYMLAQQDEELKRSQHLLDELRDAHQQLKQYAEQAPRHAVTKERNRIAQELHDSVTQMLFSMSLMSKTALVVAKEDNEVLQTQLQQLQSLSQDALSEMRYLIFQLKPSEETTGLLPALQQHIENVQTRHQLTITLAADKEPPLTERQAHALFRIVQEGINNIVKHAQTDSATLRIDNHREGLTISLVDEGAGFSQDEPKQSASMGLHTMKERATELGAELTLSSQPGKGTTIKLHLPTNNANQPQEEKQHA
jgi:signal transduction histidine kinase